MPLDFVWLVCSPSSYFSWQAVFSSRKHLWLWRQCAKFFQRSAGSCMTLSFLQVICCSGGLMGFSSPHCTELWMRLLEKSATPVHPSSPPIMTHWWGNRSLQAIPPLVTKACALRLAHVRASSLAYQTLLCHKLMESTDCRDKRAALYM